MSRNLKKEYIYKLMHTEAPKGYIFDVANYLQNPSYDYEYPSFIKVIDSSEGSETVRRVYYFKHYNGSGEYMEEIFQRPTTPGWAVIKTREEKTILESNRFSLKTLFSLI